MVQTALNQEYQRLTLTMEKNDLKKKKCKIISNSFVIIKENKRYSSTCMMRAARARIGYCGSGVTGGTRLVSRPARGRQCPGAAHSGTLGLLLYGYKREKRDCCKSVLMQCCCCLCLYFPPAATWSLSACVLPTFSLSHSFSLLSLRRIFTPAYTLLLDHLILVLFGTGTIIPATILLKNLYF